MRTSVFRTQAGVRSCSKNRTLLEITNNCVKMILIGIVSIFTRLLRQSHTDSNVAFVVVG